MFTRSLYNSSDPSFSQRQIWLYYMGLILCICNFYIRFLILFQISICLLSISYDRGARVIKWLFVESCCVFKNTYACRIRNIYGTERNKLQLATRKKNIREHYLKIFTEEHTLAVKYRGYVLSRSMQRLIACIIFRQA